MKQLLSALLACVLLLAGCGKETDSGAETSALPAEHNASVSAPEGDYLEITERLFIAQTNDIYLNPENYFDKTIRYEGLFKSADWGEGDIHRFVLRYGPGCCGYDGEAGFEIAWDGELPNEDDWVEVIGQVEFYKYNDWDYLRVNATSVTVKEERGAEYVST